MEWIPSKIIASVNFNRIVGTVLFFFLYIRTIELQTPSFLYWRAFASIWYNICGHSTRYHCIIFEWKTNTKKKINFHKWRHFIAARVFYHIISYKHRQGYDCNFFQSPLLLLPFFFAAVFRTIYNNITIFYGKFFWLIWHNNESYR